MTTRAPKRSPRGFLGSQEAPKRSPRTLHRSPEGSQNTTKNAQKRPREPQDALKTTFGSETLVFQKSSCRRGGSSIFDGRRIILGAQNRVRGARRHDEKSHRTYGHVTSNCFMHQAIRLHIHQLSRAHTGFATQLHTRIAKLSLPLPLTHREPS